MAAVLVTAVEQKVQTEAYAEEGFFLFGYRPHQGVNEPFLSQGGDGVGKGADSRQNDLIRPFDVGRFTAERRLLAHSFKGLGNGP